MSGQAAVEDAPEPDEEVPPAEQDEAPPQGEQEDPDWAEDLQDRARGYGWKGPKEWKGDPPKGGFKSPKEYLDHAEKTLPVVNARVRELEGRLKDVESEIDRRVEARVARIEKLASKAVANQRAGREQQWRNAIARAPSPEESYRLQRERDADLAQWDKANAIDPEPAPQARQAAEPPPAWRDEYQKFEERARGWYGRNGAATDYAKKVAQALDFDPDFANDPAASFAEIERRVYAKHPELKPVTEPAPRREEEPPQVDMSGGRGPASRSNKIKDRRFATKEERDDFKLLVNGKAYTDDEAGWREYMTDRSALER